MKKNYIYGVSSKYNFGGWEHTVYHFADMETAEKWLHTAEYDFREREIMCKTKAIKLAGKKAVENAIDYWQPNREEMRFSFTKLCFDSDR